MTAKKIINKIEVLRVNSQPYWRQNYTPGEHFQQDSDVLIRQPHVRIGHKRLRSRLASKGRQNAQVLRYLFLA